MTSEPEKLREKRQKSKAGREIPIPTRDEVERDLAKLMRDDRDKSASRRPKK